MMPLHDIVLLIGTGMCLMSIVLALLVWAVPGLPARRLFLVADRLMVVGVCTDFGACAQFVLHLSGAF